MKNITPAPDIVKLALKKWEPYIGQVISIITDKIQNPKRLGLYFATMIFGLSASRFVCSIIFYILSTELQGLENTSNIINTENLPRKEASNVNVDLASIIDGAFFKRATVATKEADTGATSQNFTLIGTLEGDRIFARAVIRINGVPDEPKEYALGEKIGKAVLIVIGYEKIWVLENGVKYKIEVGEASQEVQSKMNASAASATSDGGGVVTKVISRQEVNDKILGDPAAIYGGGAAFGPNLENGKITGFKLHRIPENHIFYTLGARSGDIIKSVNGYPMTNTGQMMELWNNIKTLPRVAVELSREGKPMRFNFEIRN